MHFLSPLLEKYIVDNSQSEPPVLTELTRETHLKVVRPRMITGHYQGRVLSLLSKIIAPKHILEVGTYTGYSAICLAEGLQQGGTLHTIDINEELVPIQQKYFNQSGYKSQIIQHLGDAIERIPSFDIVFDLVFIDAEKTQYDAYFEAAIQKCRPGSIILSDNVLWSGKVVEPLEANDKATEALLMYNEKLANDPRVETVLLPIRDGLTLCRVL
ncbi:O-methyltransferase [Muricauda sp. SCSIO 64092]|uniref:O-methyltransferase n=1 Tax=Allomuricauda sp. SCSIO 64092 TaxID=2908842 RepID=UPI001FF3CA40|nr:O-methyltransferase [Muricauda sp. SCSIO 64092]UOY07502.1 O-methyltransferase [Muricauda sp. SCSIO 64092]